MKSPDRKLDILLFGSLFLTFSYFYQGAFANQNSRFDLSLAMAFNSKTSIDDFHQNTIDKSIYNGKYYSDKAPGASILSLPLVYAASVFIDLEDIKNDVEIGNFTLYLGTIFSVSLLSAISSIFFRRTLRVLEPKLSLGQSLLITIATYLGTLMLTYSTVIFGHQIAASWLIIGYYFLLKPDCQKRAFWNIQHWLGCMFLALAIITEYPALLMVIGIWLSAWLHKRRPLTFIVGIGGMLPPLLVLATYNAMTFGSIFSIGYSHLEHPLFKQGMEQGFFGLGLPKIPVLSEILFGSYRGLFYFCPILLVGLLGFTRVRSREQNRIWTPLLLGIGGMILLNGSYRFWEGGTCFGPRHLVPLIPFLALGVVLLPKRLIFSPVCLLVTIWSIAINFLPLMVTPFLAESVTTPLAIYRDLISKGSLSINPIDFATPHFEISQRWQQLENFPISSFNLGELAGLQGLSSLFPLIICQLIVTAFLYSICARSAKRTTQNQTLPKTCGLGSSTSSTYN